MSAVLTIAGKELREGLRNRWIIATTLLLAGLALTLAFLGSAPTGTVRASPLDVIVVSLSSLTIFLVPLIALLLSHDAIVGERERGTLLLLLSYPVGRGQVILGKFLGHVAILAIATAVGYGAAGLALALGSEAPGAAGWRAFAIMIGSSVLLGAAFLAIGYAASTLVRDRGTAAGIAIGAWLLFVLIYDMALLGLLVADQGQRVTAEALNLLLLLNPTDVYRLLNFSSTADVSLFAGMAGVSRSATLSPGALLAAMALWIVLPLGLATVLLKRRDV